MVRTLPKLVLIASLGALSACQSLGSLSLPVPVPGDYGRPAVVRGAARAGSYVGAVGGIVPTLVLWPVTRGVNLIWDEPLGYSEKEWTFLPLTVCTGLGHYLIGLPVEGVYQLCWGLWVGEDEPVGFDHVPGAAGSADAGGGSGAGSGAQTEGGKR